MGSFTGSRNLKNGHIIFTAAVLAAVFCFNPGPALAADGASEALGVRLQAELAIQQERGTGSRQLAAAMQEALPELLLEYLVTRDGSVALDTIDAVFVREELETAKAMAEPGIALALEVFSGPGTGYEFGIRTAISQLGSFREGEKEFPGKGLLVLDRVLAQQLVRHAKLSDHRQNLLPGRARNRQRALGRANSARGLARAAAAKQNRPEKTGGNPGDGGNPGGGGHPGDDVNPGGGGHPGGGGNEGGDGNAGRGRGGR